MGDMPPRTDRAAAASRAARLLGVSRDTLRYRMEKFRLAPPR
jgi:DNA-binding protein Fis